MPTAPLLFGPPSTWPGILPSPKALRNRRVGGQWLHVAIGVEGPHNLITNFTINIAPQTSTWHGSGWWVGTFGCGRLAGPGGQPDEQFGRGGARQGGRPGRLVAARVAGGCGFCVTYEGRLWRAARDVAGPHNPITSKTTNALPEVAVR